MGGGGSPGPADVTSPIPSHASESRHRVSNHTSKFRRDSHDAAAAGCATVFAAAPGFRRAGRAGGPDREQSQDPGHCRLVRT